MTRLFRGGFIFWVLFRYGLDELLLTSFQKPWLHAIARIVSIGAILMHPAGNAFGKRWRAWVRFSSSLGRYCQPDATCCHWTLRMNWPDCRIGCHRLTVM